MTIEARDVIAWGDLSTVDPADPALAQVVQAVNAYVAGLPVVADRPDPGQVWPDHVHTGALMLAARTYRRRQSPAGIEGWSDGGVSYVARYDPDVTALLRLDAPAVG